jgi:hypothetical protein
MNRVTESEKNTSAARTTAAEGEAHSRQKGQAHKESGAREKSP